MNKLQSAPPILGAGPGFSVKVQRQDRPPVPWTWEIYRAGASLPFRRALRGYGSAEAAWEVGRAALAALERAGAPER